MVAVAGDLGLVGMLLGCAGGGGGGGGFLAGPSRAAAAAAALLHPHPGDLIKFTQQSTVNIHHQHYASSLN